MLRIEDTGCVDMKESSAHPRPIAYCKRFYKKSI